MAASLPLKLEAQLAAAAVSPACKDRARQVLLQLSEFSNDGYMSAWSTADDADGLAIYWGPKHSLLLRVLEVPMECYHIEDLRGRRYGNEIRHHLIIIRDIHRAVDMLRTILQAPMC